MLQQALKAKSVLYDESKPWRDRVLEARALLDDIGEAGTSTFASQVRRALAEDNRRVHAHLAGLRDIEFAGAAGDSGYDQWQAWQRLQAHGIKESRRTSIAAGWRGMEYDRQRPGSAVPVPGVRGQHDDGAAQEPAPRQRLGEPLDQLPRPRVDAAGGHRLEPTRRNCTTRFSACPTRPWRFWSRSWRASPSA
jgi:hypothetical protein